MSDCKSQAGIYTSTLWAIFWGVYVGLMGLIGQFPAIVVRSSFVKSLYGRWSYEPRFQYGRSALPSMFEQNPGMFEQTCNVLAYTGPIPDMVEED